MLYIETSIINFSVESVASYGRLSLLILVKLSMDFPSFTV